MITHEGGALRRWSFMKAELHEGRVFVKAGLYEGGAL